MKQRMLIRVAMFLLLGAIINVAVAWGLVRGSQIHFNARYWPATNLEQSWWGRVAPANFARSIDVVNEAAGIGVEITALCADSRDEATAKFQPGGDVEIDDPGHWDYAFRIRAGWPMRAVDGTRWQRRDAGLEFSLAYLESQAAQMKNVRDDSIAGNLGGLRLLPLFPVWPGFAINTTFYAAVLWTLVTVPKLIGLRRRIRARRGQCPACAYPVGSSDVCTECGKPVKVKAVSPT